MLRRACVAVLIAGVLFPSLTLAKGKSKATLPAYVLSAHTVAVVIDRNADMSIDDPQANQVAQRDVETALRQWGRFQPVLSTQNADLIIVVRRGSGRIATGGIRDPRQGNRPAVIDPTDSGIDIGAQHGRQGPPAGSLPGEDPTRGEPTDRMPHPEAQIGNAEDAFVIYRGDITDPLDAPPAWRYLAKDGLKPHSVPAVEAFRKAVNEAEEAAAKHP